MRAVMLNVPPELLEARRRSGLDRRDEAWEGVLHMVPPAHWRHNELNDELGFFFRSCWQRDGLGRTFPETGVQRPGSGRLEEVGVPRDYRVPDRSFLTPQRYDRLQGGWIVGGPDAVLEIVSPGDESEEKLPFYFSIGVEQVLLIDRDSLRVRVFERGDEAFVPVPASAQGWLGCAVLDCELRREPLADGRFRLHVRRFGDPARSQSVESGEDL